MARVYTEDNNYKSTSMKPRVVMEIQMRWLYKSLMCHVSGLCSLHEVRCFCLKLTLPADLTTHLRAHQCDVRPQSTAAACRCTPRPPSQDSRNARTTAAAEVRGKGGDAKAPCRKIAADVSTIVAGGVDSTVTSICHSVTINPKP